MKLVFPDEVGRGHVTKVVLDDGDEMISLAGLEVSVLSVQLNSKGIFCAENPRMRRSLLASANGKFIEGLRLILTIL